MHRFACYAQSKKNNVTLAEQCLSRKGRPIDLLQCVDGQGTPTIVWALAVGGTSMIERLIKHAKKLGKKLRDRVSWE